MYALFACLNLPGGLRLPLRCVILTALTVSTFDVERGEILNMHTGYAYAHRRDVHLWFYMFFVLRFAVVFNG